jgi:hypothetical protein
LLGSVLAVADSSDVASRSALASLQKAALEAKKTAKRPARKNAPLHNPLADTRDRRARHITGRPRPAR